MVLQSHLKNDDKSDNRVIKEFSFTSLNYTEVDTYLKSFNSPQGAFNKICKLLT